MATSTPAPHRTYSQSLPSVLLLCAQTTRCSGRRWGRSGAAHTKQTSRSGQAPKAHRVARHCPDDENQNLDHANIHVAHPTSPKLAFQNKHVVWLWRPRSSEQGGHLSFGIAQVARACVPRRNHDVQRQKKKAPIRKSTKEFTLPRAVTESCTAIIIMSDPARRHPRPARILRCSLAPAARPSDNHWPSPTSHVISVHSPTTPN